MTGRLTLAMADAGHTVTGVDPARAVLDAARAKPGADRVTWIEGTSSLLPTAAYDVAVMTSHVAQVFVGKSLATPLGPVENRRMTTELEEGSDLQLDFTKLDKVAGQGVVPCAVQNAATGEIILVAYVNELALQRATESRTAVFWSTSRNELWEKGTTSGETFALDEVLVNCEQNSLVYKVTPRRGGICHTKSADGVPRNCFYRRLDLNSWQLYHLDA